jgi:hypothetical protein
LVSPRECFHACFEPGQGFWSNFPSLGTLSASKTKTEETPVPRAVDGTFAPVYRQLEALGNEAADTRENPCPGSGTAHIDSAIVGVAAKPVPACLKFLLQFIQNDIGQER